jgi:hypothetical protein
VLILANATCLSEAQCALIRDYVARGGSVVAASDSSLADETGQVRAEFGLADVFGVRLTAPPRGPVKNSYIALNGAHPLNEGFGGAARIIGGTRVIGVEAAGDAVLPFLAIPDFPDLPMEEVYPREAPRDAAVICREAGGRVVYFPWNIGGIFWEVLAGDHQRLIENAVRWALAERPRVEVSGKAVLDVALRDAEDGLAVMLYNLTNPHMLKGPAREVWPVGAQKVSVALPNGRSGATARLLVADEALPVTVAAGRAEVTVPGIAVQEVLHLVWT